MTERKTIAWLVSGLNLDVASIRYRAIYPAAALNKDGWTCLLFERPEAIRTRLGELAALVIVKRLDPGIIHIVSLATDAGVPVILDLCDDVLGIDYRYDGHEMFRMVFDAVAPRLSLIVTTGGMLQRRFSAYGFDPAKIRVIPDCVESEAVSALAQRFLEKPAGPPSLTRRLLGMALRAARAVRYPRRSMLDVSRTLHTIRYGESPRLEKAAAAIPADPELRKALGVAPTVVWFGNHGGPHSDFGMLTLLRVARELREAHARTPFTLVVASNNRDKWKLFIQPIGVPTRFVSWSQEGTRQLLERASAFIMPTGADEFSLSKSANRAALALEAGVPVVAQPLESLQPLKGVSGADLAGALERCLRDRVPARAEAEEMRRAAHEAFGLRKIADLWTSAITEAAPYRKSREIYGAARTPEKLLVMINLAQDLALALPVIDEAAARGVEVGVVVGYQAALHNAPLIEALIERCIAPTYMAAGGLANRDFRWLRGAIALFCPTESTAIPHRLAHQLTRIANAAGVRTFTAQHGLENVGLNYRDVPEDAIEIASGTIFTWADPRRLPDWLDPSIRSRCVGVGRIANRTIRAANAESAAEPIVAVFENLHWARFDDAARAAFVDHVAELAAAIAHARVVVMTHPGGRWATKIDKGRFTTNVEVVDSTAPGQVWTTPRLLAAANAVITSPSTIAADSAELGRSVAVARCGVADLTAYAPLPIVETSAEWISFVRAAIERGPSSVENAAFLARVRTPGDPLDAIFDRMFPGLTAANRRASRSAAE